MFMSILGDGDASRRRQRCSRRRSAARVLLGEDGDHVVAFGRGRPLSRVCLTVNLVLHKEMSLLLEVDAAVRAGVTVGVAELVSQLHHHSAEMQTKCVQLPQKAKHLLITHPVCCNDATD